MDTLDAEPFLQCVHSFIRHGSKMNGQNIKHTLFIPHFFC